MRLIYIDEAGTAPKEPVRVVTAIIVEADNQRTKIEDLFLSTLKEFVPSIYQDGFKFHATDIYSGKGFDKSAWPLQDRVDLIRAVASIPLSLGAPVVISSARSNMYPDDITDDLPNNVHIAHLEHITAFLNCVERCDFYLRSRNNGQEFSIIIAEDVPHIKTLLVKSIQYHKGNPYVIPSEALEQSTYGILTDGATGDVEIRIDKILYDPIFLKKGQSASLMISDAIAFTVRRWMAGFDTNPHVLHPILGDTFASMIVSDPLWLEGPSPSQIFDFSLLKKS